MQITGPNERFMEKVQQSIKGLGHKHGCRFIILGHRYGGRDIKSKRPTGLKNKSIIGFYQ